MNTEMKSNADHWFDSTFLVLNESYQLDLRRILSPDTTELIHTLSDFYMYDDVALFLHLLALTSNYLSSTSLIYADNQLKHKLNLHLLLIVRAGYDRSSLVEHIKQSMINVQSIRQTGQPNDLRHSFHSNLFCRIDDHPSSTNSFCISDHFDEHGTISHLQRQHSSTILGTSNGCFVRQLLETKFHPKTISFASQTDWLMIFLASKTRLYCRRSKIFEQTRYPSLEQLIIVINCLCSNTIDFYFDEPQANQFMCDYLDALSVKAVSLEDSHPWMAARYLAAQEQVLRSSASLRLIEMAIKTLIVYKRTFHSFAQADKVFYDNCIRIIEQTRVMTTSVKMNINLSIVQSAIYFVNTSIKQYEIMFEPTLNSPTPPNEIPPVNMNSSSTSDRSWMIPSSTSSTCIAPPPPPSRSTSPSSKRMKTYVDPSYVKSLELAHELLLLPYVAFTRTSVYANSKLKRNAAYLDFVIDELKKYQLLILVRQGVQMIDGTRRRVDLLVKSAPIYKEDENKNTDKQDAELFERLSRFGVDYDRYVQTLATIDIGEKYRLSDQCFDLLNSIEYKRHLTIDLERIAPLHRIQQQDETEDRWSSSSSSNVKLEPVDFYV